MPSGNGPHKYRFRITGTGVEQKAVVLCSSMIEGRVRGICVREEAGGGGTSAVFALVDGDAVPKTAMAGDALPVTPLANIPDEQIVHATTAVPLTASATTASLKTLLTPATFSSRLALIANVTAGAGAWALVGYVEVES